MTKTNVAVSLVRRRQIAQSLAEELTLLLPTSALLFWNTNHQKITPLLAEEVRRRELKAKVRRRELFSLVAVEKYVQDNSHRDLSLAAVARKMRISRWHLSKQFSRHKGQPFLSFVQEVRVEAAKKRIVYYPNESLDTIARRCGFPSPDRMRIAFKEFTGKTALAWKDANCTLVRK